MVNKCFQTGSIKTRFNPGKLGKLSLAGIWKAVKKLFQWLMGLDWLKIFKCLKLIIEIIKKTRSLLSCKQTRLALANWDNNKSYAAS